MKSFFSSSLRSGRSSVWLFPLLLAALMLVLVSLKINGSSTGVYHTFLYGFEYKDPDLVIGKSQSIRSDEWLVTTQATIAQEEAGYPRINENYADGRDMSVLTDVPYKDWSAIFKPQNFSFFIMPIEYAFAFKWWILLYLLIVSSYFFCLRLFEGRKLLSVLLALGIGLNPFVFWWYQTATFAPLFYGFFILLLALKIIDGDKLWRIKSRRKSGLIYGGILAYVLCAFALTMYPPFQIPVAIVIAFYLLGYLANKFIAKRSFRSLVFPVLVMAGSIGVTLLVIGAFVLTRLDAIKIANGTVYPGERIVISGGLEPLHVFGSFVQPQLQSTARGLEFFNNQSESSNFILLLPFLLLPGLLLILYEFKKTKKIDWVFVAISVVALLFLARVFLPVGDIFYKLLLLHKVPNERLVIGIGFVGILHLALFMKKMVDMKLRLYVLPILYSLICFSILMFIGSRIQADYPMFIVNDLKILVMALGFTGLIALVLLNRPLLASFSILIFSLASVVYIHPLYRGLGTIHSSPILDKIKQISKPEDTWVVADSIVFENFGLLSGRDSLTGVNYYPDVDYWKQVDEVNAESITNRYAHILFTTDQAQATKLRLVQPDFFVVKFECSDFITNEVEYLLTTTDLSLPCLEKTETMTYPATTLYFYRILK